MKHPIKIYARALADVVLKENSAKSEKQIAGNFLKLLVKNGDQKKIKQIIKLAEANIYKKTGSRKIIIETARDVKDLKEKIIKKIFREGDTAQEKISPELIAGLKIIINDEKQFDASLSRKLDSLF